MFQSSGGVSLSRTLSISDNTALSSAQLRKMKILQAVLAVFVFLAISSSLARSLAGTEGDKFDTLSTTTGETVLSDSDDVPRATPWPHMVKVWLDTKMID